MSRVDSSLNQKLCRQQGFVNRELFRNKSSVLYLSWQHTEVTDSPEPLDQSRLGPRKKVLKCSYDELLGMESFIEMGDIKKELESFSVKCVNSF